MRQEALSYLQQAVCVRRKKKRRKKNTKKCAPPKTHHESHSSPATATTSRRRAKKDVPRVSPYSPASMNPGFVEIGLEQLSQSVKRRILHIHTALAISNTTSITHTYTQTDKFTGGAYVISNQNPRWAQKPIYSPVFTHHILSLIHI